MSFENRTLSKLGKKLLNTKKRKAFLVVADKHTVEPSYWSEGSKTDTLALCLPELELTSVRNLDIILQTNPFAAHNERVVPLTNELGFVAVGWCCGKQATPTIYVRDAGLVKELFV